MGKMGKILIWFFILLLMGAGVAWILVNKQSKSFPQAVWSLPSLSELENVNLPENLIGPKKDKKATSLDPQIIIEITNDYRAEEGLAPLKENNFLLKASQSKVEDMLSQQYFEHVSPDGITPSQLVLKSGYNYKVTGENLALGDFKDEKDLVDAWMASKGHRENILNPEYTEIGVAASLGDHQGRNTWLAVQEFGRPAPHCTKPDEVLANNIETKKSQYSRWTKQLSNLSDEAQRLADQANTKINQGNEIYADTGDKKEAEKYWDEGKAIQKEFDEVFSQAKTLDEKIRKLYNEVSLLVSQYNTQINRYNECIKD